MVFDEDYAVFSSGRRVYAYGGCFGLVEGSLEIKYGWDGVVDEFDDPLTPSERAELAEYMIALWRNWAGKHPTSSAPSYLSP